MAAASVDFYQNFIAIIATIHIENPICPKFKIQYMTWAIWLANEQGDFNARRKHQHVDVKSFLKPSLASYDTYIFFFLKKKMFGS